jgi:hypothetical protein
MGTKTTIKIDSAAKLEIGSVYKGTITLKSFRDGEEIYLELPAKELLETVKAHYAIAKEI